MLAIALEQNVLISGSTTSFPVHIPLQDFSFQGEPFLAGMAIIAAGCFLPVGFFLLPAEDSKI